MPDLQFKRPEPTAMLTIDELDTVRMEAVTLKIPVADEVLLARLKTRARHFDMPLAAYIDMLTGHDYMLWLVYQQMEAGRS
jgi:hypothetical protein